MTFAAKSIGLDSSWEVVGVTSIQKGVTPLAFPTTAKAGDLAVVMGCSLYAGTTPSGWIKIHADSARDYYKICSGGETSVTSPAYPLYTSQGSFVVWLLRPSHGVVVLSGSESSGAAGALGAMTPTRSNGYLFSNCISTVTGGTFTQTSYPTGSAVAADTNDPHPMLLLSTEIGKDISTGPLNLTSSKSPFRQTHALFEIAEPGISWDQVYSLLHFDGTNGSTVFTDTKGSFSWTAYGNAKISTTLSMFGGASGSFDGTGDYIQSNSSTSWKSLQSNPFVISGWLYVTSVKASGMRIFSIGSGSADWSTTSGIQLLIQLVSGSGSNAGKLNVQVNNSGTATGVSSSAYVPLNSWTHIVIQKDSRGVVGLGINGTMEYFSLISGVLPSSSTVYASYGTIPGESGTSTYAYKGYMEEMIISCGKTSWLYSESTYTVPTSPWPNN